MATRVEISTVAATKAISDLRKQIKILTTSLRGLNNATNQLNKRLTAGTGTRKFSSAQKKASGNARLLSKELVRQKRAAATSEVQWKSLVQSLRLAGASKIQISDLTRSVTAFQSRMRSGTLTTNQFANAQIKLQRSFGTARRRLQLLNRGQKSASVSAGTLNDKLRNIGSSAIFAVGPLSGIGARINALGAIATRTNIKFAIFAAGLVAVGVGLFKLAKRMVTTGIEFRSIRSALVY